MTDEEIDKLEQAALGGEPIPLSKKVLLADLALSHVMVKAYRDCKQHGATTKHTLKSMNVLSHWLWRTEELNGGKADSPIEEMTEIWKRAIERSADAVRAQA
jgi:hypothetical protein